MPIDECRFPWLWQDACCAKSGCGVKPRTRLNERLVVPAEAADGVPLAGIVVVQVLFDPPSAPMHDHPAGGAVPAVPMESKFCE